MTDPFPEPLTPGARLTRLGRLARKELTGVLRDRRTITTLLLMPVLLYPLLAVGFRQFFISHQVAHQRVSYTVAFQSEDEAKEIVEFLQKGERRRQPAAKDDASAPRGIESLRAVVSEDPDEGIRQGKIEIAIKRTNGNRDWEIVYLKDSSYATDAVRLIQDLAASANERVLLDSLRARGVAVRRPPVTLRTSAIVEQSSSPIMTVAVLIPLILILMTITGGVYPAIDLTAGERERGTLEILMAAPLPRLSLLFAKYVAVLAVALLTALVNLSAMTITLLVSGLGPQIFGDGLTPGAILAVLALLTLFAAFFSAVLLALTSFARSFKEAQAYLIPLMLASMGPGMLALVPGVKLEGWLVVVPLANIVLLARDFLQGHADWFAASLVVVSTLLYALAALALAARVFGAEAVLYTDQGGWGDLFRRPARARERATPAGAFLCLALLFPAYFVTQGSTAQLFGQNLTAKLAFTCAANLVLFVGFPLAAAWLGKVRPGTGLALKGTGAAPILAGLLVGLSLWPFVHEGILALQAIGFTSLAPERLQELATKAFEALRQTSPLIIVLALGLLPALGEELFFRGYLLGALLTSGRPLTAITISSGLFALFHLLVGDLLVVERLAPTFVLGLLLAWVAWKQSSIWPGVVLHAAYNSTQLLAAYYKTGLADLGLVSTSDEHFPARLLAAAGPVAVAGLVWLWWCCRGKNDKETGRQEDMELATSEG